MRTEIDRGSELLSGPGIDFHCTIVMFESHRPVVMMCARRLLWRAATCGSCVSIDTLRVRVRVVIVKVCFSMAPSEPVPI